MAKLLVKGGSTRQEDSLESSRLTFVWVGGCADAVHAGRLGEVTHRGVGQESSDPHPEPRRLLPEPPGALHPGTHCFLLSETLSGLSHRLTAACTMLLEYHSESLM